MTSSVMLLLVVEKEPRARKSRPQVRLRKSENAICARCDERPLARRTKSLTALCGGISTNIWTCTRDKKPEVARSMNPH